MNWLKKCWRAHQTHRKIRALQRELLTLQTALDRMPAGAIATTMLKAESLPVIVCAEATIALKKAML